MQKRWLMIAAVGLGVLAVAIGLWVTQQPEQNDSQVAAAMRLDDFELPTFGFATVNGDYAWEFPRDDGAHPEFQREVWQIQSAANCGVQFTLVFERLATLAEGFLVERESAWGFQQVWNARLTTNEQSLQRISRAALDLAGAEDGRVWVENWVFDWESGVLEIEDAAFRLKLALSFEAANPLETEPEWYGYQRMASATGEVVEGDKTQRLDCSVTMTHRFGTASPSS